MYALYYAPGSASMAPHGVIEETGAPYTLRRVDLAAGAQRDPEYLKLNPNGRVPTLTVDGAFAVYESAAICLFLADRHPQAGLAPAIGEPARGPYYQWLTYLTNTVQTSYLLYFYPEANTTNADQAPEIRARGMELLTEQWRRLDQALAKGPYLLGDRFSAADIYLHMLYSWRDPDLRLESDCPNVRRCAELVAARPAIRRMLQQNEMAA